MSPGAVGAPKVLPKNCRLVMVGPAQPRYLGRVDGDVPSPPPPVFFVTMTAGGVEGERVDRRVAVADDTAEDNVAGERQDQVASDDEILSGGEVRRGSRLEHAYHRRHRVGVDAGVFIRIGGRWVAQVGEVLVAVLEVAEQMAKDGPQHVAFPQGEVARAGAVSEVLPRAGLGVTGRLRHDFAIGVAQIAHHDRRPRAVRALQAHRAGNDIAVGPARQFHAKRAATQRNSRSRRKRCRRLDRWRTPVGWCSVPTSVFAVEDAVDGIGCRVHREFDEPRSFYINVPRPAR